MPRAAASPPRPRDAERTRSAVLDAAETLFSERGFAATSMADVGAHAGVSRGTPGYFFRSKAELYRAVIDRAFADALDAVRVGRARAMRSGRPAADVLAGAVSDYVDFVEAHPKFVRLIQRQALGEASGLGNLPLGQAVGAEAVAALAQELGFPPRARSAAMHVFLSLIALTWFPLIHATTLIPAIGFDADDPRFGVARKKHITALLLGALPPRRTPSARRSSR
ncbi:MAG: TetR family transcriptional regulator [Gemmatimonadota bacterium]